MFYTSLGRLLMVDLGEDEEKFDAFMIPLTQSFESLGQVLLNSGSSEKPGSILQTSASIFRSVNSSMLCFSQIFFVCLLSQLRRRRLDILATHS
jgi:hypothetical protein